MRSEDKRKRARRRCLLIEVTIPPTDRARLRPLNDRVNLRLYGRATGNGQLRLTRPKINVKQLRHRNQVRYHRLKYLGQQNLSMLQSNKLIEVYMGARSRKITKDVTNTQSQTPLCLRHLNRCTHTARSMLQCSGLQQIYRCTLVVLPRACRPPSSRDFATTNILRHKRGSTCLTALPKKSMNRYTNIPSTMIQWALVPWCNKCHLLT